MSEEVLAEVPAPEQEATAAPEPVEAQPVKAFTQEELDAAIGKRLAREQRKWERERVVAAPVVAADPRPEQFDSTESYADALAMKKAEQLLYERDVQRQQTEVLGAYHDREEEARNKYDDFEQVAYNPKLTITDVMADTIRSSDVGPELAYYLGTNPKDAARISRLAPLVQAREIGRIEAKLASDPPMKRTTSAPAPISPVTARSTGSPAYDTTDPRSTQNMTASQWIEADRARQRKKWEAQTR